MANTMRREWILAPKKETHRPNEPVCSKSLGLPSPCLLNALALMQGQVIDIQRPVFIRRFIIPQDQPYGDSRAAGHTNPGQ